MSDWISVKDKLPEIWVPVLMVWRSRSGKKVAIGYELKSDWYLAGTRTAPLPIGWQHRNCQRRKHENAFIPVFWDRRAGSGG